MTKKKVLYRLLLPFLVGGLYEVRGARPMTRLEPVTNTVNSSMLSDPRVHKL